MFILKCYSVMLKAPLDAVQRLNKIWQRTCREKPDGWHIRMFHLWAGIQGEGRVFLKESGLTLGVPHSQGHDCIWRPAGLVCIFWYISLTLYSSYTRHCLTAGTGENVHYDHGCFHVFGYVYTNPDISEVLPSFHPHWDGLCFLKMLSKVDQFEKAVLEL